MYHKKGWESPFSTWGNAFSLIVILGLLMSVLLGTIPIAAEGDVAVLSIGLKAPMHVEPGGTMRINVVYGNSGTTASAGDTWVKVTLPSGTSFTSAADRNGTDLPPAAEEETPEGITVLTWNVGAVPPGTCCSHIVITAGVSDTLAEETALTTDGQIGSASDAVASDSVTSTVCDMAGSTKQVQQSQAKPGDVLTYTLTLRMRARMGQSAASERMVDLVDILPPASQVQFLGWVGENAGTYDPVQNQLKWQGRVRAGEAKTFQYRLGIVGDVPPGTMVRNGAHLSWSGGEMEVEPVDVEVYLTENDHMFGPEGGQWQHQNGLTIDVPANAVQQRTRFEYKPLFEDTPPADLPAQWKFAHHSFALTAFQFGEQHQFNQPITITIPYEAGDIEGMDPKSLRLWYRSGPGEPWAMLGEPHVHQNGNISFTTTHFTEFALLGTPYLIRLPFIKH